MSVTQSSGREGHGPGCGPEDSDLGFSGVDLAVGFIGGCVTTPLLSKGPWSPVLG